MSVARQPVRLVAANEWRLMRRSHVVRLALAMLLALSAIAAFTSIEHRAESDALRARFQQQADREFDGQPARHPHRMVHYGHFVFRPMPALAAFDPGVDAFTGNTIFLEGHRQNSANFGDVRQSSLLARFGQLTPAFVLQVLGPLVLVFVGFGAIARERESGTLRYLKAQGLAARSLLVGKAMALGGIAALMLLPALLALGWLVAAEAAPLSGALLLAACYAAYLAFWVIAVVAVSCIAQDARSALLSLLGLWALTTILIPRIAPDIALSATPLPTRLETEIAIHEDLRRIGDSHNPDDPHFAAFKAATLKRFGVSKIEDLPVNYRGLLAMEGEKITSQLFDKYSDDQFARQTLQRNTATGFGLLSPAVALRSASMALSGTDIDGHTRFLKQAEAYRYAIVQALNRLQAEAVTYADDGSRNKDPDAARRVRIDPKHWHEVPDFNYRAATLSERFRAAVPGIALLLLWLVAGGGMLRLASRRLREAL
jgi:ABC-2 type transport system permease protein